MKAWGDTGVRMPLNARRSRIAYLATAVVGPPVTLAIGTGLVFLLFDGEDQYFVFLGLLLIESIMILGWTTVTIAVAFFNRNCRWSAVFWSSVPIHLVYLVLLGGLGGHW
jgi:hypothetical protein